MYFRELLDLSKNTIRQNQCELLNYFWINKDTWSLLTELYTSDYEVFHDKESNISKYMEVNQFRNY